MRSDKFWDTVMLVIGMIAVVVVFLCLTGCTVLREVEPNSLPVEFAHVSHLTQHAPFTSTPTNYGYNAVSLGAKWVLLPHLSITLSEGIILESRDRKVSFTDYGSMAGPREIFTGRIAYEIPLK